MSTPNCPYCSIPMKLRNGKRGQFWGCSKFPTCKGTRDFVQYPKDLKYAPGSAEQTAFWEWLEHGTENGVMPSCAGTGKTYTIVNGVARLRNKSVAVFSFNNHIIKELNVKLQQEGITWAKGCTFNSFGQRAIRNSPYLNKAELFQDKVPTLLTELLPDDTAEAGIIRSASEKLVRLCKCYLEDGKDEMVLAELVERFNVDISSDDDEDYEALESRMEKIFQLVPLALDLCLKRKTTYDFDDQVWWVVKMGLPVEKFDIVLVDEAQDTNRMQQELIKMCCP